MITNWLTANKPSPESIAMAQATSTKCDSQIDPLAGFWHLSSLNIASYCNKVTYAFLPTVKWQAWFGISSALSQAGCDVSENRPNFNSREEYTDDGAT